MFICHRYYRLPPPKNMSIFVQEKERTQPAKLANKTGAPKLV